jgi:hypothetical protein
MQWCDCDSPMSHFRNAGLDPLAGLPEHFLGATWSGR